MNNTTKYPTCVTCKYCIQINHHPWNANLGRGDISDLLGYVCTLFVDDPEVKHGVFMDTTDRLCECHTEVKNEQNS